MADIHSSIEHFKQLFADVFCFYVKIHGFHWNVVGSDFYEYHLLFERIYEEVYGSVDDFGEHIRALGAFAPGSMSRLMELSSIPCEIRILSGTEMVRELMKDNSKIIENMTIIAAEFDELKKRGVVKFIEDRIEMHEKHQWMLKSSIE